MINFFSGTDGVMWIVYREIGVLGTKQEQNITVGPGSWSRGHGHGQERYTHVS